MRKREALLKELLEKELQTARARNPRYSLRALAQRMKISPATLSRVISKKSNLSQKMSQKIIEGLKLDEKTKTSLGKAEHDPYREIGHDTNFDDIVNVWYLSPILSLVETRDFKEDPKWIAGRLGITAKQARFGLRRLQEMGFLQRNEKGQFFGADIAFTTYSDPNKADRNTLDKLEQMRKYVSKERSVHWPFSTVGSIVLSSSPGKMKEVKERTKKFRRQLAKFMDSGEKSEVYLIFTSVIPLSKIRPEND